MRFPFFAPLLRLASDLLRAGELPVWTDRMGTGFPLLASVQVPLLYPPLWPLLGADDPARWLSAYLTAHLCVAAAGGVWLARAVGLARQASVEFAAAWPASGVSLWVPTTSEPVWRSARRIHGVDADADVAGYGRQNPVDLVRDAVVAGPVVAEVGPAEVTPVKELPRLVTLNVRAKTHALVWSPHAMGPGWHVRVDGTAQAPVAVHGAFRGVFVPPGEHGVTWQHDATSLHAGVGSSLLCLVTFLFLRHHTRSSRRRSAHSSAN
jgi:hypothetical protein